MDNDFFSSTPYKRGRDKEYRIVKRLKAEGWDIVFRSAGSHSPIDIIAINRKDKIIRLIQSKLNLKDKDLEHLLMEYQDLNGQFQVKFIVE